MKKTRKSWVIALNLIILATLFFYNRSRIIEILDSAPGDKQNELFLKVSLMTELGNYTNLLTMVSVGLFVINLLLYKYWIQSKRWILEPIIILIVSFGTFFLVNNYNLQKIGDRIEMEKEKN